MRQRRYRDRISQLSNGSTRRWISILAALVGTLIVSAPAQAGSASATLQVRARIVSSCAVSFNAVQNISTTSRGRFNCPVPSTSDPSNPLGPAPRGAAADYIITDVGESDGNLKLVTFTF